MNYEKTHGGLALRLKKRGIVGFILTTVDGKYTFDVSRKQTKSGREVFDTIEKAKAALLENI